jgi:hypothetical protein
MPQFPIHIRIRKQFMLDMPACPNCGVPMWLDTIEPSNKPGHDLRTLECSGCKSRIVIEVAITD